MRDIVLSAYQAIYGDLVMPMYVEDVTYGIGIRYSALSAPTYVNFAAGIFQNQCCFGDQFPFIGNMAFACGPTGMINKPDSKENVKVFWENLQRLHGVENTPAGEAIQSAPNLTKIGGNDNTVLFPHPLAFSHASGTRVPDSGVLTVWFQTNCTMNTVTVPVTDIATGWGDIDVYDAWYSDDNEITVELKRTQGVVDGEGWLKIAGWASLSSGVVMLDGGRSYDVRFIVGNGPAAEVSGFSVVNGVAEWRVGSEWHTDHYLVEASAAPDGPWEAVAPPEEPGQPQHAVAVSGGPYFRLVEVEEGVNACSIIHGTVRDVPERKVPADTIPSLETVRRAFAELKAERAPGEGAGGGQSLGSGERLAVFTAGDSATADYYLADPWRWKGYTASVVPVVGFPRGPNNEFQNQLKQAIADSAAAGVGYFWLVGDAGHPAFAEQWNEDWEPIRQEQISWGYDPMGQPDNDEIPSWKFDDPEPRGVNWAFHNPHYFSDAPYWNTDGDSLRVPDVVGARLPFSDEVSVISYACKMVGGDCGIYGPAAVTFLVDDVTYKAAGDGAFARQVADTVQSEVGGLGTVTSVSRLDRSDERDDNANTDLTAEHLNVNRPDVICMFGALSHRYFPANFMDLTIANPWSFDLVYDYASLVLAYSCGGGSFWRNEDPNYGVPVAHRALAHLTSGAVNWVGPGDGVNQAAARLLGIYTIQELSATDRPAAESFTVAMQRARAEYGDRIDYVPSLDMFTFLGNPLSCVDQRQTLISVGGDVPPAQPLLAQNAPNPFGSMTKIRYATSRAGRVRLRVFDAAGRLVRTLVDERQAPGPHVASWDGTNNHGARVACGIYFCRLSAPDERKEASIKMMVLK
jgi:hypothetical protein